MSLARLFRSLFPPRPMPDWNPRCRTYSLAELSQLYRNHDTARRISEAHH